MDQPLQLSCQVWMASGMWEALVLWLMVAYFAYTHQQKSFKIRRRYVLRDSHKAYGLAEKRLGADRRWLDFHWRESASEERGKRNARRFPCIRKGRYLKCVGYDKSTSRDLDHCLNCRRWKTSVTLQDKDTTPLMQSGQWLSKVTNRECREKSGKTGNGLMPPESSRELQQLRK